ncbi:tetratricopeptide repeat protein [Spongiibacter taiwanensis]|uniref:tetratricopeptide repeat protein n=1 Tax=Spongiibacter taiwanensis TaxID=1748242 RepID=UPI002036543D|nr:tetratricopeptide repeat protein [Spongiibacter taiwanensis]USA44390.1 tetratricopeptide repeat protein [Spongiibacter taiwanensis]
MRSPAAAGQGSVAPMLLALPLVTALVACQSAGTSPQLQTVGELIGGNGQRPERLGISLAPSSLAEEGDDAAALRSALEHYDQIAGMAARSEVQAEALRRAADLRVDAVASGLLGPDQLQPALANYQRLLAAFPHYPSRTQVLYQRARAEAMQGDDSAAIASLEQLAADYPDSPLAVKAQFRAAEMWLRLKNFAAAERAYSALLALPSAGQDYRIYGHYKRAWARYQLDQFSQALVDLNAVLLSQPVISDPSPGLPPYLATDNRQGTVEDATRLAVLCLAASDRAQLDIFLPPEGDQAIALTIYQRLVERLLETQRITDAALVALHYAASRPDSPAAPAFHRQAIGAYLNGGLMAQATAQKAVFIQRYDPGNPLLPAAAPAQPVVLAPGVEVSVLMAYMLDVAGYHHQQFRQGRTGTLDVATAMYQRWLARFPGSEARGDVRRALAETYYDGGRFKLAAVEYELLAYSDTPYANKGDAGLAAIQSQLQALDALVASPAPVRRVAVQRLAALSQRFVAAYPRREEGGIALLQAAGLLFESGDFPGVLALVSEVEQGAVPLSPRQHYQGQLLKADALFQLGRYREAEPLFRNLLAGSELAGKDRSGVVSRLAIIVYQRVDTLRDAGQLEPAATALESMLALPLSASVKQRALFDAAVLRDQLGQWPASLHWLEVLVEQFPEERKLAEVDVMLARGYSKMGKPGAAAQAYRRLAANTSQQLVDRESARLQAAQWFQRAGQPGQALVDYRRYLETGRPDAEAAQRVRWHVVGLLPPHSSERQRYLKEIVAADEIGTGSPDTSRLIAAQAHLQLAQEVASRGRQIALVAPLATSLATKGRLLEQAAQGFHRAAEYGYADVSSIALNELGLLYRDFAHAILASQRPSDLTGEVLGEYLQLLEQEASPFEERAISAFEHNLGHVRQGLWNDALQQSLAALEVMLPGRYAKQVRLAGSYDDLR